MGEFAYSRYRDELGDSELRVLELFSGPPDLHLLGARWYNRLMGWFGRPITGVVAVDMASENELRSLAEGGETLCLLNELLPGFGTVISLDDLVGKYDDGGAVEINFIQAFLPQDFDRVRRFIQSEKISLVEDIRGGLLWLPPEAMLSYLRQLFRLVDEQDAEVNLLTGLNRWLLNGVTFYRKVDFETPDFVSSMSNQVIYSAYVEDLIESIFIYYGKPETDGAIYAWKHLCEVFERKAFEGDVEEAPLKQVYYGDSLREEIYLPPNDYLYEQMEAVIQFIVEQWAGGSNDTIKWEAIKENLDEIGEDVWQELEFMFQNKEMVLSLLLPVAFAEIGITNLFQAINFPLWVKVPEILKRVYGGGAD